MADATGTATQAGTVGALVREMAAQLERAGIADAKREAGDIVAAVNDAPRFWALLHELDVVSAGVADGDRVVTLGVQKLVAGAQVRAIEAH